MLAKFPLNFMIYNSSEFVRGFFSAMESAGYTAASLHGWENGFDGELSDVDVVVCDSGFSSVVNCVSQYASICGWRLCQVLRHESTALFCVCSNNSIPTQVVALDICSDYRRNERMLISSQDLLAHRELLPWGAYRLCDAMELRYRFIKAAVKGKSATEFVAVFERYSDDARKQFEIWLNMNWGIVHSEWNEHGILRTWLALELKTREAPIHSYFSHLQRIFFRVLQPTGLIVSGMNHDQDAFVSRNLGNLYFRRQIAVRVFNLSLLKPLVASTLIKCQHLSRGWIPFFRADLLLEAMPHESPDLLLARIVDHLESRCSRREKIRSINAV
jgi:hypothetical protein